MADDRYVLIGGADQLEASPAFELDFRPSIDTTRYPSPDSFDSLALDPIAVGHWSYSIRFENYPPPRSIDLVWLYSYLPPNSGFFPVVLKEEGDRAFVPGLYKKPEEESHFVDQCRWIYPEGLDALGPGRPCAWNTALEVDWVIYPPAPSIDIRYMECYAPPDSLGGPYNRGMEVLGRTFTEYGDVIVGQDQFVLLEGLDSLAPGAMCAARWLPSLRWRIYPPLLGIDMGYAGCYAPPRQYPEYGPVFLDFGYVYDREAVWTGHPSLETGDVLASVTQYVEVPDSDQFQVTPRHCVTRPYSSIWLIYPPVFPVELQFRCSYRPPRAYVNRGPVVFSALFPIDSLAPAQGFFVSAYDQQGISYDHGVEAGEYVPPQIFPVESTETLWADNPWVFFYESFAHPHGLDAAGFENPSLVNVDRLVHKSGHETLDLGSVSVSLWDQYFEPQSVAVGLLDPSGHLVELADSTMLFAGRDQFEWDTIEVHIPEPIVPEVLDSLQVEPFGKDAIFPSVTHWLQRPLLVGPNSFISGPLVVATDQEVGVLWAYMFREGMPAVVRHMEVRPSSDLPQTLFDQPVVLGAQWVEFNLGVGQFQFEPPLVWNFNPQAWLPEAGPQTIFGLTAVATDQILLFRSDLTWPDMTQHARHTVANETRESIPQMFDSFETSNGTVVEKNKAANYQWTEQLQIAVPWVSHDKQLLPITDTETLRRGRFRVDNSARVLEPEEVFSEELAPFTVEQWERTIRVRTFDISTEPGTPIIGWNRLIEVPRNSHPHLPEYGALHVAGWEQFITPVDLDGTLPNLYWLVEEKVNLLAPRTLLMATEYGELNLRNTNRDFFLGGNGFFEWGLAFVEHWDREITPSDLHSYSPDVPLMIWARPVELHVPDGLSQTLYGWRGDGLRLDNESTLVPIVDQFISVRQFDEDSGEEIFPTQTEYAKPTVSRGNIVPDELDSFAFGPLIVDGGIEVLEREQLFQYDLPVVTHFFHHITPVWQEMKKQDEKQIGEPGISPQYAVYNRGCRSLFNAPNDGALDGCQNAVDPSAPEVRSSIHAVGVGSAATFSFGSISVRENVYRMEVRGVLLFQPSYFEIEPRDQWIFSEGLASLEPGEIEVEIDLATVFPFEQSIGVGDISQTQIGQLMVEGQHRAILVVGLSQTLGPSVQQPPLLDVDFEKRIHPIQAEMTEFGETRISTDPQYVAMEPGHDSFDPISDYQAGLRVRHDQQMTIPVGLPSFAAGIVHVRRGPNDPRAWSCP